MYGNQLHPIHLAGGGGRRDEKILDCRALLAFRQLPPLVEGFPTAIQVGTQKR